MSKRPRKTALLKSFGRHWTNFESVPITPEMIADHPLLATCRAIYANSRYEVQMFAVETSIGGVMQVTAIRHGDIEPAPWEDLQRLIHEIFGPEVVAVEVYPALQDEWVSKLNLRVVWILPATWTLPFGLHLPTAWGRSHA